MSFPSRSPLPTSERYRALGIRTVLYTAPTRVSTHTKPSGEVWQVGCAPTSGLPFFPGRCAMRSKPTILSAHEHRFLDPLEPYGLVHKAADPRPTRRHSWCSSMGSSGTVAGLGAVCLSGSWRPPVLTSTSFRSRTRPGPGSGPRSHRRPMIRRLGSTPSFRSYRHLVFVTHGSGGLVVKDILRGAVRDGRRRGTEIDRDAPRSVWLRTRHINQHCVPHQGGAPFAVLHGSRGRTGRSRAGRRWEIRRDPNARVAPRLLLPGPAGWRPPFPAYLPLQQVTLPREEPAAGRLWDALWAWWTERAAHLYPTSRTYDIGWLEGVFRTRAVTVILDGVDDFLVNHPTMGLSYVVDTLRGAVGRYRRQPGLCRRSRRFGAASTAWSAWQATA